MTPGADQRESPALVWWIGEIVAADWPHRILYGLATIGAAGLVGDGLASLQWVIP